MGGGGDAGGGGGRRGGRGGVGGSGSSEGGDKGDRGSGGGGGADGSSFGHRQPEQSHPNSVRKAHVHLAPRHADGKVAHSSQLRPWQVAGQLPGGSRGCEGAEGEASSPLPRSPCALSLAAAIEPVASTRSAINGTLHELEPRGRRGSTRRRHQEKGASRGHSGGRPRKRRRSRGKESHGTSPGGQAGGEGGKEGGSPLPASPRGSSTASTPTMQARKRARAKAASHSVPTSSDGRSVSRVHVRPYRKKSCMAPCVARSEWRAGGAVSTGAVSTGVGVRVVMRVVAVAELHSRTRPCGNQGRGGERVPL